MMHDHVRPANNGPPKKQIRRNGEHRWKYSVGPIRELMEQELRPETGSRREGLRSSIRKKTATLNRLKWRVTSACEWKLREIGSEREGVKQTSVGSLRRDVAIAKYSDWVSHKGNRSNGLNGLYKPENTEVQAMEQIMFKMRKPLEKLRPPSATELLLSNDGDHILEGCLTNFFILSRKDNMEEDGESAENMQKNKYGYSLELQTAPISGGVLPGVVREVVIDHGTLQSSILPLEFGFLYDLRLLQHVDTIRVPVSWNSLSSKTWKEVTWEAKEFEEGPGSITTVIQVNY
ncbi:D-aminoacid aminotransferase-like PLP-dependent enzymes superfamily protein [Tanacetum coccineum]